jgi:hypothetical protein
MADGKVVFEITGDNSSVIKTLKDTTQQINKESKQWDKSVDDSSGNISDNLIGAFKAVATSAAFIKIGKMLLQLGGESIELASDLQEVQNVVDSAFGSEGAEKVNKWAEEARKNFGLTELQAKRYASTMGAIFKTNGIADDQLVKMSTDIAGLAADMASYYNMDFDVAFNKIQSGLAGMPQPLREIGVQMTEAAVSAYAMANGYETAFDKMSESEKLLVRYHYLMDQTTLAQGDFTKTSNDFANSQRRMATGFDTLKAKLGEALLPIATEVSNAINDMLDLLIYDPSDNIFDQAEDSIADAAGRATEAQGILGYMDKLYEKYGSAAESTDEWRQALEKLKAVFPEVNQYIDDETGKLTASNEQLKEYIENSKQAAIEDAKKAAIAGLNEQYIQAGQDYYTAEIKRDIATEEAAAARQSIVSYIQSREPEYRDTGFLTTEQLSWVANSWADEFGDSKDTIREWVRIFNEQTNEANKQQRAMDGFSTKMKSLEADLSIANAALARLSAAAESAASSVGGLPGINIDGSHARGLDYVPFDGYLARLHQGEGILTSAENTMWQNMKYLGNYNGITSDVLNAILGSNMESVKAGGNVYLDGMTVGKVISDMQGQQYRSLQRSGWQQ